MSKEKKPILYDIVIKQSWFEACTSEAVAAKMKLFAEARLFLIDISVHKEPEPVKKA